MTDWVRSGDESAPVSLEEAVGRIGELVSRLEQYHDPTVVRSVFELLDWIDVLHREGLERLVGGLQGSGLLDRALDDPVVAHLFAVYGLVESDDVEGLVEEALAEVRPYTRSHGGEMTLDRISGGVVHLRMHGACDGCPSAVVTLTDSVTRAIRTRWPGLVRVEVSDSGEGTSDWTPVSIGRR